MAFMGVLFVILLLIGFVIAFIGAIVLLIVGLILHKKAFETISLVILIPQIIILAIVGIKMAIEHHENMQRLFYCLENGKYKQAEKLLKKGGSVYFNYESVNSPAKAGKIPYFIELCQSNSGDNKYETCGEQLQFLIDHGADVEYRKVIVDHKKDAPEHFKSPDSDNDIVKKNIGLYGDSCGMTPLMISAKYENIKTFKVLIENGADVNAVSYCGRTVLMYACAKNYGDRTEIIKTLLEKGVDVNAEDNFGLTAMDFAKFSHNQEAVNLLKEYQEKNK